MKNKKLIFGIIIGIFFLLTVGLSYAYFSTILDLDGEANDIVTETGTLRLTYVDGPQIVAENIRPGWEITKTVSVENTGSLIAFYSINWLSINNTVERNELVMSSTCTGTDCRVIEEEPIGNVAGPFASGIRIEGGVTHTYTLTFKLKEMSSVQNYNQGKLFNGVLNIEESVETFTLNGRLLDSSNNPIANAQITLHSDPQTTTTDAAGKFTFENVEVGNHTIEGINGSSVEILDDSISVNSGETFNVSGTKITKESAKNEINVEIKLGVSNNISNITNIPTIIDIMNLASAQSDEIILFSMTNDGVGYNINKQWISTATSNSNGQGLYYTSDLTKTEGGERVYYYRGAVENNYVVFAGYCWRIVRTNEDGSIRIRYGGEPTGTSGNYTCPQTGTSVRINTQAYTLYNQTYGDNTYVGYMMGLENECANTTNCSGTVRSTSENAQSNIYDSNIKSVIDGWYEDNIVNQGTSVTSKIANTIYCNDRSLYSGTGIGTTDTIYGAHGRFVDKSSLTSKNINPQYKCSNVLRDGFTLSVVNGGTPYYGNNALTYPIGLLTPDEVVYAGGLYGISNSTYYLNTGQHYWTMGSSTQNVSSHEFLVDSSGKLVENNVYGISTQTVPVISLKSNALVKKGRGEYNSPYEIE